MDYEILSFPSERKLVVDAGYLASGRHIIYGLVEVDVTDIRREMLSRKAAGEDLSFTAYIAAGLGRAIAEHPEVQAYRDWRGRLVIFREVDVVVMVEPQPGRAAIPHIIRAAQAKSVSEISAEIRAVQAGSETEAGQSGKLMRLAPLLPRFIRLWFFHLVKLNPARFKGLEGTTIITSLGMFGKISGWGITFLPVHTLGVTVGSIVEKPVARAGQVEIREILHLTLAFDHDLVDGAPAARFTSRLVELLQEGDIF